MLEHLKKYLSIFCLVLFLFPLIEKDLHALEHQSDIHCNASNKHFHSLEHACSICDFTITDSNYSSGSEHQYIISIQQFLFYPFVENVNTLHVFQLLPARAPPVNLT